MLALENALDDLGPSCYFLQSRSVERAAGCGEFEAHAKKNATMRMMDTENKPTGIVPSLPTLRCSIRMLLNSYAIRNIEVT